MNILLINHYAGSVRDGMEYRPYYMAREWIRAGHQVQILAASYSHVRTVQPLVTRSVQDEVVDGVAYRWYKTPRYESNGMGRIRNMLSFMWSVWKDGKRLARQFAPDIVIASSTYPMDIWPAQRIAQYAKAKLVYEVHDLWPLSPMTLGQMSKWHPFIVWVQYAEDWAYKRSDFVVSMLPKTLSYMVSRGLSEKKWRYVPNGISLSEPHQQAPLPDSVSSLLLRLRQTGRTLIGYTGSYGTANALDCLLETAALMPSEAEFVLVGGGSEKASLQERIKNENLRNVHLLDAIAKSAVPAFLASVDIAYIGWLPNPLYRFGISPNKLMDYMMAAKPIVHSVSAGNDVVKEADCGVSVPPNSPDANAQAIRALMAMSPEARRDLGLRGRTYVQTHLGYDVLASRFIDAITTS